MMPRQGSDTPAAVAIAGFWVWVELGTPALLNGAESADCHRGGVPFEAMGLSNLPNLLADSARTTSLVAWASELRTVPPGQGLTGSA